MTMKNFFLSITVLLFCQICQSQNLSTAPTSEADMFSNARGGSPMLNLVMMDLRNNQQQKDLGEVLGSPYSTPNFIKSSLYYGEESQGEYYVRYNALNSIIEIKKTSSAEEEPKQLYADKEVRVKYLNKELRFTTYINKKNETKNGYLSLIYDGKKYKLYHRLAVKYSEGKAAANSMVSDIPSRFAHFEEYYFQKDGINRIDFLPSQNGKFLKQFEKEVREQLKTFIQKKNINLGNEEDLTQTFEFLNTL